MNCAVSYALDRRARGSQVVREQRVPAVVDSRELGRLRLAVLGDRFRVFCERALRDRPGDLRAPHIKIVLYLPLSYLLLEI